MKTSKEKFNYFVIYKPYDVLSQFTKEVPEHKTLADFYQFPETVYPVGRLDKDSEGLLILTDDNQFKTKLLDPEKHHKRTYLVQVEGEPDEKAVESLSKGVLIQVNKTNYKTRPAIVRLLKFPPDLPDRDPPIRFRKSVPTSWLQIILEEGKNRQIRKMCAKVGYPVLRLVRTHIGTLSLNQMQPGQFQELKKDFLYKKFQI